MARRSRLPRWRSSDRDMGATADSIKSPKINWRMHPNIPVIGPADQPVMSTPYVQMLTAPIEHAIPVEPPISTIKAISQRDGRERCHSRQSTGLRSSDGPGSQSRQSSEHAERGFLSVVHVAAARDGPHLPDRQENQ